MSKAKAAEPEVPRSSDLATLTKDGYKVVADCIRSSNSFPMGVARDTYGTFTSFNVITNHICENISHASNEILQAEGIGTRLRCNDDDHNVERIIEANDTILESISILIDTVAGLKKKEEEILVTVPRLMAGNTISSWNTKPVITKVHMGESTLLTAKNITRPQLMFKDPVDNSPDNLWVPKIKYKPNNIKPLALTLQYDDNGVAIGFEHPYEIELDRYQPPAMFLEPDSEELVFPPPLEDTKLTMVQSEAVLDVLVKHLEGVTEIAVDVEHHGYRTYQGITCLLQISTDSGGDFIIDTLTLREHLHKLNEAFTNPKILKVLHGANFDVIWLQRDLGIYIVGLFDTYQAARELKLPGLSLKALMQRYCNLNCDKKGQMADWRIRPLPQELITYARNDTHHLLYIYRNMRNELLKAANGQTNLLLSVFEKSRQICTKTYTKTVVDDESHMRLHVKTQKSFNSIQLTALKMLYKWRDNQARLQDESTSYVLPNEMLLKLAETLPRELQGIYACCHIIPPLVKQNVNEIHRIILSCRELPIAPRVDQMPSSISLMVPYQDSSVDLPHDFAHNPDFREDLPTMVNGGVEGLIVLENENDRLRSVTDVFNTPPQSPNSSSSVVELNVHAKSFIPPFEQHRQYRKLAQVQELKEFHKREAKVAALNKNNKNMENLMKAEVLLESNKGPKVTKIDNDVPLPQVQENTRKRKHKEVKHHYKKSYKKNRK